VRHGGVVEFDDGGDVADALLIQRRIVERLDDHPLNGAAHQRLVERLQPARLTDAIGCSERIDQFVGGLTIPEASYDTELKLVVVFKIGQVPDAGILAHEQVELVAEVPGELRVAVALVVGDAGQAEIERAGLDQLPDARPRHQAHADIAAAAAAQFVGEILVDARVGVLRIQQAMVVQRECERTRAVGAARSKCTRAGGTQCREHD
jgi:hypothetical protein